MSTATQTRVLKATVNKVVDSGKVSGVVAERHDAIAEQLAEIADKAPAKAKAGKTKAEIDAEAAAKAEATETRYAKACDKKIRTMVGQADTLLEKLTVEFSYAKVHSIWRYLEREDGTAFVSYEQYVGDVLDAKFTSVNGPSSVLRAGLNKFLTGQGVSTRKAAALTKTSQTQVRRDRDDVKAAQVAAGTYEKPAPQLPKVEAVERMLAKVVKAADEGRFEMAALRSIRTALKAATDKVSDAIDVALDARIESESLSAEDMGHMSKATV